MAHTWHIRIRQKGYAPGSARLVLYAAVMPFLMVPQSLRYLGVLTLALAACVDPADEPAPRPTETQGQTPESGGGSTEKTAGAATPPTRVGQPEAPSGALPFHLYVSNQSFEIDPADIDIYVDGVHVVTGGFRVESQHNWVKFDFELAPGEHALRATSRSNNVDTTATFSASEKPWGVVNFWYYPAGRDGSGAVAPSFGVDFFATQPGFD